MKLFLLTLTLLLSSSAMASQLSCKKSIELAVNRTLKAENIKSTSITIDDADVDGLVNLVLKVATVVHKGKNPAASTWLVVATPGPMSTCSVENVIYDSTIAAP